jgi:hypothetical protein
MAATLGSRADYLRATTILLIKQFEDLQKLQDAVLKAEIRQKSSSRHRPLNNRHVHTGRGRLHAEHRARTALAGELACRNVSGGAQ